MQTAGIITSDLASEMKKSFIDYAMSVVISRALPDVRDGLKPVHRRILYSMSDSGMNSASKHYKCARIVGDVIGKYHPHGDQSVYDALVRLAQPWVQRQPLVDGQGNFGSIDADPAAAMRYTEARLTKVAEHLVLDINRGTVAFQPNYDGSEKEPCVLPARFPNLLVNGGMGIAVGMASNIPPHNLTEVINATLLMLDKPDVTLADLMAVLPGPDFPTAGVIKGTAGIREAYLTGAGRIPMEGVASIEAKGRGRSQIIINQLPYGVVKEEFIKDLAEQAKDKKIDGITDIRDESDREEMVRVAIDVRSDSDPNVVLNYIRRQTDYTKNFGHNATCLSSAGDPVVMGLQRILSEFIQFRRQVVRLRTSYELDRARDQQVKQIGLFAAVSQVEEVVRLIRTSHDRDEALIKLMQIEFPVDEELAQIIRDADPDVVPGATFRLNEVQTDTILRMSLASLTGLARADIANDLRKLAVKTRDYIVILLDPAKVDLIIKNEMIEIREKFPMPRLTKIEAVEADGLEVDSLIERRDIIVTLTKGGYIKRTDLSDYRAQRRGSKGRSAITTKEDDYVISTQICSTLTPLIFFTAKGKCYALKAHQLPDTANGKGRPIVNFIDLEDGDAVTSLLTMPEDKAKADDLNLMFVTESGTVRRSRMSDFLRINKSGKIAMKLEGDDGETVGKLVTVLPADESDTLMLISHAGNCSRISVGDFTVLKSRESAGLRGMAVKKGDFVVDACILNGSEFDTIERQAYCAGGSCTVDVKADEMPDFPATVTVEPAKTADHPNRYRISLKSDRHLEMQRSEQLLLTISKNGYGKRSSSHEYRIMGRGAAGMAVATINDVTGPLAGCLLVKNEDDLIIVTDSGQIIRTRVQDIATLGRAARGVKLFQVPDGQRIASIVRLAGQEDDAEEIETTELAGGVA